MKWGILGFLTNSKNHTNLKKSPIMKKPHFENGAFWIQKASLLIDFWTSKSYIMGHFKKGGGWAF